MDTTTDVVPAWNGLEDAPLPTTPIDWIARSYEKLEEWKKKAREVYFSVNGDSNVARNRVAALARKYFVALPTVPEVVRRWKKGSGEVEAITMLPPKVTESNSAYFDWLHIADFLLLACNSVIEELPENQTRADEYRAVLESFRIRTVVFHARKTIVATPEMSDDETLASLKLDHPTAALAHIKAARKLERDGAPNLLPREPLPPSHIARFEPIYFGGN